MKSLEERQEREFQRNRVIEEAVQAADRIIMDFSNGSIEETNFLTIEVARKFMGKVWISTMTKLLKKDMED
jgi:hypothetical protein